MLFFQKEFTYEDFLHQLVQSGAIQISDYFELLQLEEDLSKDKVTELLRLKQERLSNSENK